MFKKSNKKRPEHCCERMEYYLKEKRVLIYYNSLFREYFIGMKSYPWGKQVIYCCPWCGKKFPFSLVDKYIDILLKEYEILFYPVTGKYFNNSEKTSLPYEVKDVPEEFKSDEWWKKRGL